MYMFFADGVLISLFESTGAKKSRKWLNFYKEPEISKLSSDTVYVLTILWSF